MELICQASGKQADEIKQRKETYDAANYLRRRRHPFTFVAWVHSNRFLCRGAFHDREWAKNESETEDADDGVLQRFFRFGQSLLWTGVIRGREVSATETVTARNNVAAGGTNHLAW